MIYLQPPPVKDDPEVILVEQNGNGHNGDVITDNEEEAMLPKETSKKSWVLIKKYSIHIYLPIHTIIFDLIIIYTIT